MTHPFTLGVDLDGVVADYETRMREVTSILTGVPEADIPVAERWSFAESGWPFKDEDEYRAAHHKAVTEYDLFKTVDTLPGASDAMWKLSDAGVRIRIVTYRLITNFIHGKVISDTVEWLDMKNIPYRDICFVKDKADILGCDMYLDDSPTNIESLRYHHGQGKAIVFTQAYNKSMAAPRVDSWDDVLKMVSERTGLVFP